MRARKYIHIKLQPTKYDDKPVAAYRTIICILYSQLINCMPVEPLYCIFFPCKLCMHSSLQTTPILYLYLQKWNSKSMVPQQKQTFLLQHGHGGLEYIWNLGSKLHTKNKIQNIQTIHRNIRTKRKNGK